MPPKKPEPSFEAISSRFHLPLNEAARELGICETLLKKYCRKYNIQRWLVFIFSIDFSRPYRKFKSVHKKLHVLRNCPQASRSIIVSLTQQIEREMSDFLPHMLDEHMDNLIQYNLGKMINKQPASISKKKHEELPNIFNLQRMKFIGEDPIRLPSFAELCKDLELNNVH